MGRVGPVEGKPSEELATPEGTVSPTYPMRSPNKAGLDALSRGKGEHKGVPGNSPSTTPSGLRRQKTGDVESPSTTPQGLRRQKTASALTQVVHTTSPSAD